MTPTRHLYHVPAGTRSCDYLDERINPALIRAAGFEFVARYLRNTTPEELNKIIAAGLGFVPIFQSVGSAAALLGYERGVNDGLLATRQALLLGYPQTEPIIRTCDTDAIPKNLPVILDYMRGFNQTCPHPQAYYGDWDLLEILGPYGVLNVQAASKGWSFDWIKRTWKGTHPFAHVQQNIQTPFQGSAIDANDVVRPVQVWAGRRAG